MDPTTVFCPNLACPARGQTGQGNIRIHVQKEQRFICTECRNSRFAYFYWGFTNLQCAVFSSIRGFIYLSYSIFRSFACQMGSCPQYDRTSIGSSLFFKIKLPILGNELPK